MDRESDGRGHDAIDAELKRLTTEFFRAVSFDPGQAPPFERIHALFIENGLLIKNSGATPEISSIRQFIEPRQASIAAGELTQFREWEIAGATDIFGNVAQRFTVYGKAGILKGASFEARGIITTQFVRTPLGWKMSAMAWDDERPGVSLADRYRSEDVSRT